MTIIPGGSSSGGVAERLNAAVSKTLSLAVSCRLAALSFAGKSWCWRAAAGCGALRVYHRLTAPEDAGCRASCRERAAHTSRWRVTPIDRDVFPTVTFAARSDGFGGLRRFWCSRPVDPLPSVSQRMSVEREQIDGFDAGDRELPTPLIPVSDQTRDRLAHIVYAVAEGSSPEEIAGYLEDGFPERVTLALRRPGEMDEMRAHADILTAQMQSTLAAAA